MAQQFDKSLDTDSNLRAQRMTADESRAVIDLWQQEQTELTGLTDKPAVPDVAEGLDITIEDVQRLLLEVRAKRLEEERALAVEQELSEVRLAEEERKLAEIQRQRAELRREQTPGRKYIKSHPQRVQAEPVSWEEAKLLLQTEVEPFHWTESDFLACEEVAQEEAETAPKQAYRSEGLVIAYAFGGILLMFLMFAGLCACLRP